MSGRGVLTWAGAWFALLCAGAVPAFPKAAPPPLGPRAKQEAAALDRLPPKPPPRSEHPPIDRSGRKEAGKASYYARQFDGRRMADGRVFNPHAAVAASKTLPLGTTAKVIDLNTGRSADVTVQDRGPFVDGRVIDVSPKVATRLDLRHSGVAPVVVKPIAVPLPNGAVKLGAGAAGLPAGRLGEEVRKTETLTGATRR